MKLLFIGGSREAAVAMGQAFALGYDPIVVDQDMNCPGIRMAKKRDWTTLEASTYDPPGIINALEEIQREPDGVVAVGSDVGPVVSEVAYYYELPHIPKEITQLGWDKIGLKTKLQEAGIAVPQLLPEDYSGWAVVKPLGGRGGRGVYLVNTDDPSHINLIKESKEYGTTFLEQYIKGPQISTESIVYDGDVIFTGLTDRCYDLDRLPRFIEVGGYGPSVFEQSFRGIILKGPGKNFIQRIVDALGIKNGTIKGDVVLRQETFEPYLIEAAIGRLSGGYSCSHFLPLAYQVDFLGAAFALATGQNPHRYVPYKMDPQRVVVAGGYTNASTANINKERGRFRMAISSNHPAAEAKLSDMGVDLP